MKFCTATLLIILAPLSACGGSGKSEAGATPLNSSDDATLEAPMSGDSLVSYSTDALSARIRQSSPSDLLPIELMAIDAPELDMAFSVNGYEYVLTSEQGNYELAAFTDEPGSAADRTPLHFNTLISGYATTTDGGELIVVGEQHPYSCPKNAQCKTAPKPFFNPRLTLQWFSLKPPLAPTEVQMLAYDGRFLASARAGEQIVIVSAFQPKIKTTYSWQESGPEGRRQILSDAVPEDYLASSYDIDATPNALLADSCYVADDSAGFTLSSAINITTIDLPTRSIVSNTCLLTGIASLSMSNSALALQLSNGDTHDFVIEPGTVTYLGVR